MHQKLIQAALALAIGLPVASALAAPTYAFRIPSSGLAAPVLAESLSVSLAAATLPSALRNQAYTYDFGPLLTIAGEATPDYGLVTYSSPSTLPGGLSLTGSVLSGTPTAVSSGSAFTVVASYKGQAGQRVYTLQVGESYLMNVKQIAANAYVTCAVTTAGAAYCWGNNTYGQLGSASPASSATPVRITSLGSSVASIGVGGQHSCALTTAGGVKCWGDNVNGYLGNSSTTASFSPVDVTGLTSGVAALSVGYGHTCVVTTTGGAKCWGYGNGDGRLGGGTMTNSSSPVNVSGLTSGVASISAGYYSTCAVTTAGAAKCWGHNGNSQLGNNSTSNSATPVDVSGLASGVKNVSVGGVNACALTTADAVKCWGNNTFGQLGNNTKVSSGVPVNVSSLSAGVASINTGNNAACAVLTTGGLQCWGANASGQLGINSTTDSLVPVTVSGLTSGVASVVTGTSRACALLTTGTLKCWGENGYGSLGDGTSTRRLVPVDVLQ